MSSQPAPPHGGGPGHTGHRERLLPSPGVWSVVIALGLCAGVIVLPVDRGAAVVVALLVVAGCTAGLLASSPVVGVVDGEVVAGRAHVPLRFVASADALDAAATRDVLGPHADARAMLRIRPWVHSSVRITLDDPDDPVPAWIVSSRRPEEFAAAIAAAKHSSAG